MERLEPSAIWCGPHLEPFEERWPAGYLLATMTLIEQALSALGVRSNGSEAKMAAKVLGEAAPLCCFAESRFGSEWLAEMVRRALVMDPKLVQEIKASRGARKAARLREEKKRWQQKR